MLYDSLETALWIYIFFAKNVVQLAKSLPMLAGKTREVMKDIFDGYKRIVKANIEKDRFVLHSAEA